MSSVTMIQFRLHVCFIVNIYSTKKTSMKKVLIAASLLIPFISFAHDGHGVTSGFTITHYFVEPGHAIYTWSFIVAGFVLAAYLKRKNASK
jgi:hypothetical protein